MVNDEPVSIIATKVVFLLYRVVHKESSVESSGIDALVELVLVFVIF